MPHCAVPTTTPLSCNVNIANSIIQTRSQQQQNKQKDLSKQWRKVKGYVNNLETRTGLKIKQGRKPADANTASVSKLNIHERPVRKKKKNKKYENYVPQLKMTPQSVPEIRNETNVLFALGLMPVGSNGLKKMHVTDEVQPEKGAVSVQLPADPVSEPVKKALATTTVDDRVRLKDDGERDAASPKINGVCDSAGQGTLEIKEEVADDTCNGNGQSYKEEAIESAEIKDVVSGNDVSASRVKEEDDDLMTVESSEPQDLTVTCTSTYETSRIANSSTISTSNTSNRPSSSYPAANYISISVEQCQSNPVNIDNDVVIIDKGKKVRNFASQRKRSARSSDSENDGYYKRNCRDDRDQTISEYVDKASDSGLEDLQRNAEKLQQEIHSLSALARKKELEWNDIIRMKCLKEEMYTRLLRRKQALLLGMGGRPPDNTPNWDFGGDNNRLSELFVGEDRVKSPRVPSNLTITKTQPNLTSQQLQRFLMNPQQQQSSRSGLKISKTTRTAPFPILPKPSPCESSSPSLGRQGAIVDVKTIIADYRQSHPEQIPRRGRRMKSGGSSSGNGGGGSSGYMPDNIVSSSRGVLSMSSIALGSGSQVRTVGSTSGPENDATSRPSSADSSRSETVSFKDVLVQYAAKMSSSSKPPPPYPEVTLHPVIGPASQSPPPTQQQQQQHSSLLHGILTKTHPSASSSKQHTTFSPTLARLLTTPDRPSTTTTITTASVKAAAGTSSTSSAAGVSISELLSTSKKRNELTITPVVSNVQLRNKEENTVTNQNEEDLDDSDRLVIDESEDQGDRNDDPDPDSVPECQGCHREPAQFVCAGCGAQWYCSRNCQVQAWDDHSEVCSG